MGEGQDAREVALELCAEKVHVRAVHVDVAAVVLDPRGGVPATWHARGRSDTRIEHVADKRGSSLLPPLRRALEYQQLKTRINVPKSRRWHA